VNRAIRRPAGPCRTSSSRIRRALPNMAFEVPQPLSTSEASGPGPTGGGGSSPGYPRFRRGESCRKIGGSVVAELAGAQFRRFGPRAIQPVQAPRPARLPAKETGPIYGGTLVNQITPRLAVEVLTGQAANRLRMVVPCSQSRSAACARGAVRLWFFLCRVSRATPEVSKWRRHRHEYRADQY
jgi:hypothetical protein